MIDRLVILQTRVQCHAYVKERISTDIILPIGPEAIHEAELAKWKVIRLRDLWNFEEYHEAKRNSEVQIEKLIDELNSYSRQEFPEEEIPIGYYYGFQLWIIIGQIHFNSFIVKCIKKSLNPRSIICYTKSNPELFMLYRPDPQIILGEVLINSGLYNSENLRVIRLPETKKNNTIREQILSSIPGFLRSVLRRIRDNYGHKKTKYAKFNLLLIGAGGDWLKIRGVSAFNRIFNIFTISPSLKLPKSKPSNKLVDIFENVIKFNNSNLIDIGFLIASVQSDLKRFAKNSKSCKETIKRFDAIVTSVLSFPEDNFYAHKAYTLGKPVIVWQHGEKGQSGFDHLNLFTELYFATDYLAYAPVIAEQYNDWLVNYRKVNIHVIGSLEKKVEWVNGDTILYATGKWFNTAVPFLDQPDPDFRLYEAHKHILNFLDKSQIPVIFKANNTPGLNTVPYQFGNIRVEYTKPFTSLLENAKAVILDTPATTLVEACSTKVPVFVLGGRNHYTNEFLSSIKKRVVWCDNTSDLILSISSFLEDGTYKADVNDTTYLLKYGANTSEEKLIKKLKLILESRIDESKEIK
ncbi:hypothetical protein ND860_10870 [Leptospira levettii]|uniref:hypothetical protein n=1 Tax=Leptospira levettii TaxID=2023178 RepID=UPI00223CB6C6|nr:hypothetical protein [Leptospira levettii]MCW7497031.1 hypothetical protein [Leptospira levettii]